MRQLIFCTAWCLAVLCALIDWARADEPVAVDKLIITGIDISGSMDDADLKIEVEGIAMAIQAPDVLAAIQRGPLKRIGFIVFFWSDGDMPVAAPWRVIGGPDDAAAVATELVASAALVPPNKDRAADSTNLTRAILNAAELVRAAPFKTDGAIVNVVTDGAPTAQVADVPFARTQLLAAGASLNGMIVGGDANTVAYFRNSVIGGDGAFLITAAKAESLVYAFRRKFRLDLALAETP